ncbi:MAG: hypothetical protein JSS69_07415 [Acidobacteria bacterium]|nr:hypothetical protein [Acidobacteriota bacterium]MBS1865732.1 hypothetical protein [Acidobacteriota bacterium]
MNVVEPRYVGQAAAALLLKMSEKDLCRISKEAGFGHKEVVGIHEEYFFTIDELRMLTEITTQTVN